jgi:thiamine-phosphate pyrophosphorylase
VSTVDPPRLARLTRARVPALYAIADADLLGLEQVPEAMAEMARRGLRWIQLRAKHAADDELARAVERAGAALSGGAVLWMNDRPDLAALYDLRGVHLGQDDLPPHAARAVVGESCWIGLSTHDLDQVAAADSDPDVDLVALGPIFPTLNKKNADPVVGLDGLRRARAATAKPLVAIGGIGPANLGSVLDAGADSAAVLGAVSSGDVGANCERLLEVAAGRSKRSGSIYLTGFMGAGKSAVGRRLAKRLGLPFVDLDQEIETRSGRTIPELFRERGEPAFRALESEILEQWSRAPATVIATGGGVVESADNLAAMLRTGRVLWLDVPFDTLLERLARGGDERPLFHNPEQARRLYESRLRAYARCDLRIRFEPGSSADQTAARVERLMAESCAT